MLFNGKEAILEIFFDISERTRKETIQHIVYEIANAVTSTFDLNELYQTIKDLLGTVIDTSNFFIALYEEGIETLSGPFIADEKDSFTSLPLETSLSGYVIRSGKPLLIKKDNKVELMDHEKLETHGTESAVWLGVPLKYHGKITGALVVQSYDNPEAYNESDLRILEYVSHQVVIALERKRAEQELLRAIEKAEESDRLKSAFLANMSHEIRTPMNSILGFSELLKEPDVSNNQKQTYIKVIGESGERMLHTINSLIEISKLEAGETYVAFSNVNIAEVFDYFFALFKPETDKKMLSFSCPNLELASELTISTDQEKLYGILTNLMKNAIKFTNNGSIEFGCQLKDDFVEFYVTDTGIGIAKDKLQIVFERFRQVEKALSRTREGSGLGLAITKANVELLGGSIWVESEEGKGSQFHFTIPNHA